MSIIRETAASANNLPSAPAATRPARTDTASRAEEGRPAAVPEIRDTVALTAGGINEALARQFPQLFDESGDSVRICPDNNRELWSAPLEINGEIVDTVTLGERGAALDTDGDGTVTVGEFVQALDGTVDRCYDNILQTPELLNEVYGHPLSYGGVIDALRGREGLEDPLAITPQVEWVIGEIFPDGAPEDLTEAAAAIIQRLIPQGSSFRLGEGAYQSVPGFNFFLDDQDMATPLRLAAGSPLPSELIVHGWQSAESVHLNCFESTKLLTILLRAIGIEAGIFFEPGHAFVVADLGGERYRLDIAQNTYRVARENEVPAPDLRVVSRQYSNEAVVRMLQGASLDEVNSLIETAVMLDPGQSDVLLFLGMRMIDEGRGDEGIYYLLTAYDRAAGRPARIRADIAQTISRVSAQAGDYFQALEYLDKWLQAFPDDATEEVISLAREYRDELRRAGEELGFNCFEESMADHYLRTIQDAGLVRDQAERLSSRRANQADWYFGFQPATGR